MKPTHRTIGFRDLARLDECPRRLWLNQYGDKTKKAPPTPRIAQLADAGQRHESRIQAAANVGRTIIVQPAAPWPERIVRDRVAIQEGIGGILNPALEIEIAPDVWVRGEPDRIERVPHPTQENAWAYQAIEIKEHHDPQDADLLQLDVAMWVLHQLYGTSVDGELWLGRNPDGSPSQKVIHPFNPNRVPALIERWRTLLTASTPPPIVFVKICQYCHWAKACDEAAESTDDIVRLPGLRQETVRTLRENGITTLSRFAALSPTTLRQFPYIKTKADTLSRTARAITTNTLLRLPNPPVLPDMRLVFDLEFDPDSREPWAWGWAFDPTHVTLTILAPVPRPYTLTRSNTTLRLVPNADSAWKLFADAADTTGALVHWGNVDKDVIVKYAPYAVRGSLAARCVDGNLVLTRQVALPLPRRAHKEQEGLKSVGALLGLRWPEEVATGLTTWPMYQEWRDNKDEALLHALLAYHRTDVAAVMHIWRWLLDLRTRDADAAILLPAHNLEPADIPDTRTFSVVPASPTANPDAISTLAPIESEPNAHQTKQSNRMRRLTDKLLAWARRG